MNTYRIIRDARFHTALLLSLVFVHATGCVRPHLAILSPEDAAGFRSSAIAFLKEAAFGDDPILRMHAIEAFKEVAPQEGLDLQCIPLNIDHENPAISFAALMAAGEIRAKGLIEKIRTRAESPNPHVRMAAIFALHRLGDTRRTSELSQLLLDHPDARVRANAALVISRLGGKKHIGLLKMALHREKKSAPKLQILEALAMLGDRYAAERLIFDGYSAVPQQSKVALMMLVNSESHYAEDLFRYRLDSSEYPEIQMQAARGLARLGDAQGLDPAIKFLFFNSPRYGITADPVRLQIDRVRGLAALALEAMAAPDALGPMKKAFDAKGQSTYVRIAIARAAVWTIDHAQIGLHGDIEQAAHEPTSPRRLAENAGGAEE